MWAPLWLWLGLVANTAGTEASTTWVVESGQTLWGIARTHGCSVEALRDANPLGDGPLLAGTTLQIPSDCAGVTAPAAVHVVVSGETLSHIAAHYGTSVQALQAGNALGSSVIVVGQKLQIPKGEASRPPIRVVAGQSVGRPHRGKLVGGTLLPASPAYYRRRPTQAFAAAHVVDYMRVIISEVRGKHPGLHRLAVGDLSAASGGPIIEHRSHQSGRDIDVGLYFKKAPPGYPKTFVAASAGELDLGATWDLIAALHAASSKPGGPERVFLDYAIQRQIYDYARAQGVSRKALAPIFQAPRGRAARGRFVQHVSQHHDHLHIRFACPASDATCR